ncbi:MAG: hypothetical protein JW797_15540 [Bradymonadales bacterium]|nr:hypothetical protein [Bradymonadales bacterium]
MKPRPDMNAVGPHQASPGRPGFTMIELLVLLFLATVGMVTVYGIQLAGNLVQRHARDINAARSLASTTLTRLRGETINWNSDADLNATRMPLISWALNGSQGIGGGAGRWVALPAAGTVGSPRQNALGIPNDPTDARVQNVPETVRAYNPRYCVHYNLQWVGQILNPLDPSAPRELLRAQVRVFWPITDDAFSPVTGVTDCGYYDPEGMAARTGQFRYIQTNTVLYRHEAWL